jgi:signal transduction histidine kinase
MTSAIRIPAAWWRKLSLWPRLIIVVTIGFAGLFAIFSVLALRAVDDSSGRILRERVVIARMASAELARVFAGSVTALRASARFDRFDAVRKGGRQHVLVDAHAALGPVVLGIYVLDANRRPLAVEPASRLAGARALSSQPFVARALARKQTTFSAPFRDVTGRPAVALAVPLAYSRRAFGAALVEVLDASAQAFLGPLQESTNLGRTGHAELVGPGGIALASTETGDALEPGEHRPFYLRMLRSRATGIETTPFVPPKGPAPTHKTYHVMAWAPLAGAPYGVTIGGSETETFAAVHRLRRNLLLGGAGALLVLWLLALAGARLLVRPVRTLTLSARAMASGDLDRAVRVSEGGEIGLLAESLEAMRVQLAASLAAMQQWGHELETKVTERTAELRLSNQQLAAVAAVATAASRTRSLDTLIEASLDAILAHTHMDGGAVRLVDPREGRLGPAVCRGTCTDYDCCDATVGPADCACGDVLAGGGPLYLAREPSGSRACPAAGAELSVLPLRTQKGLIGVMSLSRMSGELASRDERRTLTAIADHLAIAIENAQLLEELAGIQAQREAQRMKTELISSVSHELRTPLGFIKGYVSTLLRDGDGDAETRRQFLEIIEEETARLEGMVDDLLETSLLQTARLPIARRVLDARALIETVAQKTAASLTASGHALITHPPDHELYVLADPLRIEQVLENLLENASRYAGRPGPIEVALAEEDGYALIAVRDHGRGVPDDERERVFEPFYRGEQAGPRAERGVGLGLAICRGLVEAHGGTIWVEKASGGGAAFVFSLELAEAASAEDESAAGAHDGGAPAPLPHG